MIIKGEHKKNAKKRKRPHTTHGPQQGTRPWVKRLLILPHLVSLTLDCLLALPLAGAAGAPSRPTRQAMPAALRPCTAPQPQGVHGFLQGQKN